MAVDDEVVDRRDRCVPPDQDLRQVSRLPDPVDLVARQHIHERAVPRGDRLERRLEQPSDLRFPARVDPELPHRTRRGQYIDLVLRQRVVDHVEPALDEADVVARAAALPRRHLHHERGPVRVAGLAHVLALAPREEPRGADLHRLLFAPDLLRDPQELPHERVRVRRLPPRMVDQQRQPGDRTSQRLRRLGHHACPHPVLNTLLTHTAVCVRKGGNTGAVVTPFGTPE